MKIRNIALFLICFFCMAMHSVSAEKSFENVEIEYIRDTGIVSIKGEAPFLEKSDDIISLLVLKPETDMNALIKGDISLADCGIHVDEVKAVNKAFEFSEFKMDKIPLGDYIVKIAAEDAVFTGKISYALPGQVIELLKNAKDKETARACVMKYNDIYKLATDKEPFKSLADENKDIVYERLCNRDFKDIEEIQKIFDLNAVLAKIYEGPWGSLEKVINDNKDLLGTSFSGTKLSASQKDTVCKKITGKLFADEKDFADGFGKAVSDVKNEKESGGSSARPSRGGGGGGAPVIIDKKEPQKPAEPQKPVVTENKFSDTENHWAKDYINNLAAKNIVSGKSEDIFAPDDNITRAEAVKIIVLAFDKVLDDTECKFNDIKKGMWMYQYVAAAVRENIANGYDNNNFGINDKITREDFAVMVYRAADLKKSDKTVHFADEDQISDYALEAVVQLNANGIINGFEDGSFMPEKYITRAEAAKIISEILK